MNFKCKITLNKTKHRTPFCMTHKVIMYDCGCRFNMKTEEMKWCWRHSNPYIREMESIFW